MDSRHRGRGGRGRRGTGRGSVDPRRPALPEDATDVAGAITSSVLVAGIGNIFLGDDGFGPEVLRRVPPSLAGPDVRFCDYGIRGVHLAYDLLDGWDSLVLVDALPCRGLPGELHVFEADRESQSSATGLDAHAMDPAAVFASLRALGGRPPFTVVIGCEVSTVADGIGLSEPVAAAVPYAVDAVGAAVARLSNPVTEG